MLACCYSYCELIDSYVVVNALDSAFQLIFAVKILNRARIHWYENRIKALYRSAALHKNSDCSHKINSCEKKIGILNLGRNSRQTIQQFTHEEYNLQCLFTFAYL